MVVSDVIYCILAFQKAGMMLADRNMEDMKDLVHVIFLCLDSHVKRLFAVHIALLQGKPGCPILIFQKPIV